MAEINRELYMPDNVDRERMKAHAMERAKLGDLVVLHGHAKGVECAPGHCALMYLVVTSEQWLGELEGTEYQRAHQR